MELYLESIRTNLENIVKYPVYGEMICIAEGIATSGRSKWQG